AEIADTRRSISPSAQSADGGHAGVIPAFHILLVDQLEQLPLAHHRVIQIEARKLVLLRGEDFQLFNEPVVQWPVGYKFEGADRVGDLFNRITLSMCEIVHRVYAPF